MFGPWGNSSRRTATLAGALAMLLATAAPRPAQAQFFFWDRPHYTADDVARMAIQHGFRVLAKPTRSDDVYLADVLDQRGRHERLVVSADSGEILQRLYLDNGRGYRRYADPSIPGGPRPPGRIPDEDRGPLARLSPEDGGDRSPALDQPEETRPRPPRPRRPRAAIQAPETVRPAPVESAPLAPPTQAPAPLRAPAPPAPAPAQAALPSPAAMPAAPPPAPVAVTPPDKPTRPISRDPLAIPGSREHDAEQAALNKARATGAAPQKDAGRPVPARPSIPVAPLE